MQYPFVVGRVEGSPARLPSMREVRQTFQGLPAADAVTLLNQQWERVDDRVAALPEGASVAVAVGSRGIADLVPVVRAVIDHLKEVGCAKIDIAATTVNAFTSCCPEDARIPAVFPSARDAILSLLTTVRPTSLEDARIVYIRNTMTLDRLWVSTGCLGQIDEVKAAVSPAARELRFDETGSLVSPFLPLAQPAG
jgi:hypothetical protein